MKNSEQVFGYIRVSGTAQVEKGYGLADQERVIKEYCKTNKLELITIFRDEGISGAVNDDSELDLTGRPGLMNLLDNLGNVKRVVVKHTNRI